MHPDTAALLAAPLLTPRLALEPQNAGHAEAFYPALLDDEALYQWISMDRPASLERLSRHWLALAQRGYRAPDGRHAWPTWAVRRQHDGALIGRVDAEVLVAKDDEGGSTLLASNLGFYFFSPFWGQGYASEAAAAALAHLAACGVRRCAATVTVGNHASGRVLRKIGFRLHRILPGNDVIRGVAMDDEEYVWEAAQA